MAERKEDLRANLEPLTSVEMKRLQKVVLAAFRNQTAIAEAGLSDPNGRIRAAAITSMHRLGALNRENIEAALQDEAIEARLAAVRASVQLPWFSLKAHLGREQNPLVLESIIFAIGEKQELDAYPQLCEIATDNTDALCREAAVAAIANFQREDSLEVLIKASQDKPAIRRRVAIALAGLDSPGASALLQKLSTDRDWQTRQIAQEILAIEHGSQE